MRCSARPSFLASSLLALLLGLGRSADVSSASTTSPPEPSVTLERYVLVREEFLAQAASACVVESARFWHGQHQSPPLRLAKVAPDCQLAEAATVYESVPLHDGHVVLATPESIDSSLLASLPDAEHSWQSRMRIVLERSSRSNEDSSLTFQQFDSSEFADDYDAQLSSFGVKILHIEPSFALLHATPLAAAQLDTMVPSDTRLRRLAFKPGFVDTGGDEKPEPHFSKPRFNPLVDHIITSSAFNVERIRRDARTLTGEDKQPSASWHSRHSSTYGARRAAEWIKDELTESLRSIPGAHCSFWEYDPYFSPNIVCEIPATSDLTGTHHASTAADPGLVVVSAHYDSRGTFGSVTAPGGDDDGSGTSALLAVARAVGHFGVQFASPVQLVAFSGEEQGLVGSQHYAAHLRSKSVDIALALQMDMLAYRRPGEPFQLAFPDKLATVSATKHIQHLAQLYVPELVIGYTPACCSDHQSFWENGFPATWVFERNGPIADPMYHNSGDVSDRPGYDLEQLRAAARVVTASLLNVAGFYL